MRCCWARFWPFDDPAVLPDERGRQCDESGRLTCGCTTNMKDRTRDSRQRRLVQLGLPLTTPQRGRDKSKSHINDRPSRTVET
jgi:hypothetical protein